MAEWSCSGLQSRLRRFDSDPSLQLSIPQRYQWGGKEQLLSLGTYPEVSLATARERGDAVRKQVANDVNPSVNRQAQKVAPLDAPNRTYKAVALDWFARTSKARNWTENHTERVKRRFEAHFFTWLGAKDIGDVTDDDFLACLQRLEDRNILDTAQRAVSDNDSLFRFAKKRKLVKHNIVADVRGPDLLPRRKRKHHAALTDPAKIGPMLRAIDAYHGSFVVRSALLLQPLAFVRPGSELRWAKWSEFQLPDDWLDPNANVDGAEWRIPPERMKMRAYHVVPLSRQAVATLRELYPLTGPEGYVFPQVRNASRPISENTLNVGLRAIGYPKDQQTAHGFRTTASTLLNEQGWNPDAIERQLAHGERDESRASYNAAQYLDERRKMMQAYADYLDGLKAGGNILPIRREV